MTDQQLQAARAAQAPRYPWLSFYLRQGPRLAAWISLLLGGLAIISIVADPHLSASEVVGRLLFVAFAGAVYWSLVIGVELLRVFMDLEIHLRRFVDGD